MRGSRAVLLAVLGYGQVVGWGGTYFMPSVLGAAQERDLGLPAGAAFPGITLMLVLSGMLAPRVGRLLERRGSRGPMAAGFLGMAAGLAVMAAATGWAGLLLAWVVLGLAAPLCLSEPANVTLVRAGDARRSITGLLLITGFTTTVVWPALAGLQDALGWRGTLWVLAGTNLLAAGLHAAAVPAWSGGVAAPGGEGAGEAAPGWTPALRWVCAALALGAFVSSGVQVHLIALIEAQGLGGAAAVALAAMMGPVQIAARLLDLAVGRRFPTLTVATLALAVLAAGFAAPLLPGGNWTAYPFLVLYSLGAGAMTVLRPVCVLAVSEPARFAAVQGRVSRWVTIAMAVAPTAVAGALSAGGAGLAFAGSLVLGVASVGAMRVAARMVRGPGRDPGRDGGRAGVVQ